MRHRKVNHLAKKVAIRNGVECYWCGERLSWKTFTVDHVIPLMNGGSDFDGNREFSCASCNQIRGFIHVAIKGVVRKPQLATVINSETWVRKFAWRDPSISSEERERFESWSRKIRARKKERLHA